MTASNHTELYTAEELRALRRRCRLDRWALGLFVLGLLAVCAFLAGTAGTLNAPRREWETVLLSSAGGIAAIAWYSFGVREGRLRLKHCERMLTGERERCRGRASLTGERGRAPGSVGFYRVRLEEAGGGVRRLFLYEKKRGAFPDAPGEMTLELVGSTLVAWEAEI